LIKAKDILRITESYYDRVKIGKSSYEVFLNPSPKELRGIGNQVRFTADAQKKQIFVWDAEVLHWKAREMAGFPDYTEPGVLDGEAEKVGGSYEMVYSDQLGFDHHWVAQIFYEIIKLDWSWSDKYIKITPYLDSIKTKLGKSQ